MDSHGQRCGGRRYIGGNPTQIIGRQPNGGKWADLRAP